MKAQRWLERAREAISASTVLIGAGHDDHACSRAYYAMFYAARAALFHVGQPERALGKTHSGLTSSFSQFLVLPGLIEAERSRDLQNEFTRRLIADYEADGVTDVAARQSIANATAFVTAVAALIEA